MGKTTISIVSAPPFPLDGPDTIAGLRGWYQGDTVTTAGTGVNQWTDLSGNAIHLTQTIDANRPSITSSDINGHDSITFNGTSDVLAKRSGTLWQTNLQNVSHMFCVVKVISTTGFDSIMSNGNNGGSNRGIQLSRDGGGGTMMNWAKTSGGSRIANTAVVSHGTWVILEGVANRTAGHIEAAINGGTFVVTTGAAYSSLPINGCSLGSWASASADLTWANCSIAEAINYDSALGTTDRATVITYLQDRYAI